MVCTPPHELHAVRRRRRASHLSPALSSHVEERVLSPAGHARVPRLLVGGGVRGGGLHARASRTPCGLDALHPTSPQPPPPTWRRGSYPPPPTLGSPSSSWEEGSGEVVCTPRASRTPCGLGAVHPTSPRPLEDRESSPPTSLYRRARCPRLTAHRRRFPGSHPGIKRERGAAAQAAKSSAVPATVSASGAPAVVGHWSPFQGTRGREGGQGARLSLEGRSARARRPAAGSTSAPTRTPPGGATGGTRPAWTVFAVRRSFAVVRAGLSALKAGKLGPHDL